MIIQILTTSNITDAIDLAFVDRADIKAYIGPPGLAARYDILRSCVLELALKGVIDVPSSADASLPPPWAELPPAFVASARAQAAALGAAGAAGGGAGGGAAGRAAPAEAAAATPFRGKAEFGFGSGGGAGGLDAPPSPLLRLQPLSLPPGEALLAAAAAAEGLSGRALRKLPFLAHATGDDVGDVSSAPGFLRALHAAVLRERADRGAMGARA
jgi:hypothetical protein